MQVSLNQIDQTCRKAARGAGLPWGVADDVGKGMRWLAQHGFDAVAHLVLLFDEVEHAAFESLAPAQIAEVCMPRENLLSPIMFGVAFGDCLSVDADLITRPMTARQLACPLIAVGVIGNVLQGLGAPSGMRFTWDAACVGVDAARVCARGDFAARNFCGDLHCEARASDFAARTPQNGGVPVAPRDWRRLEEYAHRTYVAADETSRLRGAGAGLSDND